MIENRKRKKSVYFCLLLLFSAIFFLEKKCNCYFNKKISIIIQNNDKKPINFKFANINTIQNSLL